MKTSPTWPLSLPPQQNKASLTIAHVWYWHTCYENGRRTKHKVMKTDNRNRALKKKTSKQVLHIGQQKLAFAHMTKYCGSSSSYIAGSYRNSATGKSEY